MDYHGNGWSFEAFRSALLTCLFPSLISPPFFLFSSELLEDILREKPLEADGIDSVVVVDNVPQVGPERLEKLKNVIHKIFSKFGKITTEFYPEADGLTKGYVNCCLLCYGCILTLMLNSSCKTGPYFTQVHLLGVWRSYPGPRGSKERRWLQTRQTTYIQSQPLHWLW